MATGRSSFAKRQRDMAKKAKAEAKRQRRLERNSDDDDDVEDDDEPVPSGPQMSNDEIMEKVADLHRRYEDGQMDLDTFDEEKAHLMAQISID